MKSFYLFCAVVIFTANLHADWFERIQVKASEFKVRYDPVAQEIGVLANFTGEKIYLLTLFSRFQDKIYTINDITNAQIIFSTNKTKFLYRFKPQYNGKYYIACAFLYYVDSKMQRYALINNEEAVEVRGLAEKPAAEKKLELSAANNLPEKTTEKNSSEESAGKSEKQAVTEPISAQGVRLLNPETRKLKKADISEVNNLIKMLREVNLEMRTGYFLKKNFSSIDIYRYFVKHTEAVQNIDNLYISLVMNEYNWPHIEAINREYRILNGTFSDISRKIYDFLSTEKRKKDIDY